jgi:hypothetical protein
MTPHDHEDPSSKDVKAAPADHEPASRLDADDRDCGRGLEAKQPERARGVSALVVASNRTMITANATDDH